MRSDKNRERYKTTLNAFKKHLDSIKNSKLSTDKKDLLNDQIALTKLLLDNLNNPRQQNQVLAAAPGHAPRNAAPPARGQKPDKLFTLTHALSEILNSRSGAQARLADFFSRNKDWAREIVALAISERANIDSGSNSTASEKAKQEFRGKMEYLTYVLDQAEKHKTKLDKKTQKSFTDLKTQLTSLTEESQCKKGSLC